MFQIFLSLDTIFQAGKALMASLLYPAYLIELPISDFSAGYRRIRLINIRPDTGYS